KIENGVSQESTPNPLDQSLKVLKGSSKAKALITFLFQQSNRKATLLDVTRHLYGKHREPTRFQLSNARQLVRRTAAKLDASDAPLRLEWNWSEEIELADRT